MQPGYKTKLKAMKKSIAIVVFMLISFGIKVMAGNDNDCYVKAGDKAYFGTDVKTGIIHTRIILPDGTFAEFDNRDITAYKHHDKLYMLMPVICNNSDTLCMELMEYITTTKSGYTVFRFCCSPKEEDRLTDAKRNHFFIFKEGKFYRRIDEEQTEALAAFGIKVI